MPKTGMWRAWAILYALIIVYVSTVLGPLGFHYVPISLDQAWSSFLSISYYEDGAGQRPDWIANLLMLLPLGFLLCATFRSTLGSRVGLLAPVLAMGVGLTFILAVKFAQLWFPPRTVSLNYIIAQAAGYAIGVGLFLMWQSQFARFAQKWFDDHGGAFNHPIGRLLRRVGSFYPFYLLTSLSAPANCMNACRRCRIFCSRSRARQDLLECVSP